MRSLIILSLVAASFAIESNFYREESCANVKGYCVLEPECPHAVTAPHKNLCLGQQKQGAVCCTNFPEKDLNCNQLHHACLDQCPGNLDRGRKGCASGQTCCTLV